MCNRAERQLSLSARRKPVRTPYDNPAVELTGEGRPYPPRVEVIFIDDPTPDAGRQDPPDASHRPLASYPAIGVQRPRSVFHPSPDSLLPPMVPLMRPPWGAFRALCGVRCGRNSVGRVSAFQADCRGFESRRPLQLAQAPTTFRFSSHSPQGPCSSVVEHVIGNDGVTSSILVKGSSNTPVVHIIHFHHQ